MTYFKLITIFPVVFSVLAAVSVVTAAGQPAAEQKDVYFEAATLADRARFVIRLRNPDLINHARDILSGDETRSVHLAGTVVKAPAVYNSPWSFHIDPGSVSFFQVAAEVCDSSVSLVERNVAQVGGAFLPKSHWCPWSSQLLREVNAPEDPVVSVVSSASMAELAISPGSLASILGEGMSDTTEAATGSELPTKLAGIEIELTRDGSSTRRKAPLLLASPKRINFLVPEEMSDGLYSVRVIIENKPEIETFAPVESPAPGIFFGEAQSEKYAAATLLRVRADGSNSVEPLLTIDSESGEYVPVPLQAAPGERLYLSLYGTGIGGEDVSVLIDGQENPILFSGPQNTVPGLDQINLEFSPDQASKEELTIVVSGRSREGEIMDSVPVKILGQPVE